MGLLHLSSSKVSGIGASYAFSAVEGVLAPFCFPCDFPRFVFDVRSTSSNVWCAKSGIKDIALIILNSMLSVPHDI